MSTNPTGHVALVGAGPGDPGLLTVRGMKLLQQADLVVYDYLANPRLLAHAPGAEKIFVGKQAAKHSMSQADINQLLVDQGKLGKRVVRLKGGDPFVFGRGGEEGEALRAAGVSFEIVPGITAAIAAPAYAGIPVTHRDFNSSFTLITGHEKEEAYKEDDARARDAAGGAAAGSSDLDWPAIAKLPCVAFYMGVKALPRITAKLVAAGRDPATPAATIQWGTTPRQRTCVATLGTIAEAAAAAKITAPAITIVGRVVGMRDTLNWFERRPLFGQTVVVTRTREGASELAQLLEDRGANVIEAPTIEVSPVADLSKVDAVLRAIRQSSDDKPLVPPPPGEVRWGRPDAASQQSADPIPLPPQEAPPQPPAAGPQQSVESPIAEWLAGVQRAAPSTESALASDRPRLTSPGGGGTGDGADERGVDWIVFTSASGVRVARDRLRAIGLDARALAGVKVAVIGEATADAVRETLCIEPDCVPARAVAEALADALIERHAPAGKRFVLLRAEIARPVLVERLTAAGAVVDDVAVYTTTAPAALPPEVLDALAGRSVQWVTFTSSSTASNFTALLGPHYRQLLAGVKLASIGPVTTATLRELGLEPSVIADKADMAALAEALCSSGSSPPAGG
ncbi:MAG TPA: uroporphyrinogen-III C-methyltransferase [Tepidisphaeraceae bacterium]